MASVEQKVQVHWAVKAFVFAHMFLVFTWAMPHFSPEKSAEFRQQPVGEQISRPVDMWVVYNRDWFKNTNSPTSFYLTSTGLWQSWDMFAPNPADTDVYVDAVVTFQDGSEETYSFERIYDMPIPQKYVQERYRKFREYLSDDYYSYKWPRTAMRMALLAKRDKGKVPSLVVLRRHWMQIQPPGKEQWKEYNSFEFFRRFITAEELEKFEAGEWNG